MASPDPWVQPAPEVASPRVCGRCGVRYAPPLMPGWTAAIEPRPAWVCPQCVRDTGMQPGDPVPDR